MSQRAGNFDRGASVIWNHCVLKVFRRHGLEKMDALGQKFDPNQHEALFQVPVPDKEPNTVVDVQTIGYILHGRTIRPAKVGVSRKWSWASSRAAITFSKKFARIMGRCARRVFHWLPFPDVEEIQIRTQLKLNCGWISWFHSTSLTIYSSTYFIAF